VSLGAKDLDVTYAYGFTDATIGKHNRARSYTQGEEHVLKSGRRTSEVFSSEFKKIFEGTITYADSKERCHVTCGKGMKKPSVRPVRD
jgi:hypothetical protein